MRSANVLDDPDYEIAVQDHVASLNLGLLTLGELEELPGAPSRSTLERAIRDGRLPAWKSAGMGRNRECRVRLSDVRAFLMAERVSPVTAEAIEPMAATAARG